MKLLIFPIIIFGMLSAQASEEIILNCSISIGPDQQASVLNRNGSLVLKELTNRGAFQERALSFPEWNSRSIRLRSEYPGEISTLSKTAEGWSFTVVAGGSVSMFAYADCE